MINRFAQFPRALAQRARTIRVGEVPVLLAHPDWTTPAPTVVWMHGRTASKELDPGRYLRWIRAGVAACAVDLPGHGERAHESLQGPTRTPEVLAQMVREIDGVVEALAEPALGGVFDLDRLGIGGMSAGGMAALRRLCDRNPFVCAAVECTTGWLGALYYPEESGVAGAGHRWSHKHPREVLSPIDPMEHLAGFAPIPLLALHSDADAVVPWEGQRAFVERLREHYRARGAAESMIEVRTWPTTGAPEEHSGFGRVSNEAKNVQVEFLARVLGARATEAW